MKSSFAARNIITAEWAILTRLHRGSVNERAKKKITGNKDPLLRDRWLSCTMRGPDANERLCAR